MINDACAKKGGKNPPGSCPPFPAPDHQTDKRCDAVNLVHQVGDNELITRLHRPSPLFSS